MLLTTIFLSFSLPVSGIRTTRGSERHAPRAKNTSQSHSRIHMENSLQTMAMVAVTRSEDPRTPPLLHPHHDPHTVSCLSHQYQFTPRHGAWHPNIWIRGGGAHCDSCKLRCARTTWRSYRRAQSSPQSTTFTSLTGKTKKTVHSPRGVCYTCFNGSRSRSRSCLADSGHSCATRCVCELSSCCLNLIQVVQYRFSGASTIFKPNGIRISASSRI